jgi:hypothetical protein
MTACGPRLCVRQSRTILKKYCRIKKLICKPMNIAQKMPMPAISENNFHVRGLKINNEKKIVEETVIANECAITKLGKKLLTGPATVTARASRVLMMAITILSIRIFLKFDKYLKINLVSYRSSTVIPYHNYSL